MLTAWRLTRNKIGFFGFLKGKVSRKERRNHGGGGDTFEPNPPLLEPVAVSKLQ